MNEQIYVTLHQAADRLALESARKIVSRDDADYYIEVYKKVFEYLVSEYEKHDIAP